MVKNGMRPIHMLCPMINFRAIFAMSGGLVRALIFASIAIPLGGCVDFLGLGGDEPDPDGLRASTIWVDTRAGAGQYNSLVADQQGWPHISYYDSVGQNLKYASLNSVSEWEIELVDEAGDVGMYTSLAMDSEGRPHIAYFDASNRILKYAFFIDGMWDLQVVSNLGGRHASLALDAKDVAHIVFLTEEGDLAYLRWDAVSKLQLGAHQILDTEISYSPGATSPVSVGLSIGIRPDSGHPVVAYYHAPSQSLQLQAYMFPEANGDVPITGWGRWSIDGNSQGNNVGDHLSLFIQDEESFHLSYFDRTAKNLKYATFDAANQRWIIEIVDADGGVGEWSSIIQLCKEVPHSSWDGCSSYISYYDRTNQTLKIAVRRNDGGAWKTFRAEFVGANGTHTSMAGVSRGRVGIAFHNSKYKGLKFLLFLPF